MCVKIKMSSLFLNSLLILNLFLVGSLPNATTSVYSDNIILDDANSTNANKTINLYINSSIFSNISNEISIYVQDLQNEGYIVQVFNCSSGEPGALDHIANLKSNLTSEYHQKNISGAVLIGNFPHADYFGGGAIFPCDLFLMDLDGLWLDLNIDGIYEGHFNGSGDMYPEIFIGRINPYVLSMQKDACTEALRSYFKRNHEYRIKAILFIEIIILCFSLMMIGSNGVMIGKGILNCYFPILLW